MSTPTPTAAFDVDASIATELSPLPIAPARRLQLQRAMFDRVRRSVEAHRDHTTVRREDGVWAAVGPGVKQRTLSDVGGLRIDLLQVDPQAQIAWPQDAQALEVLVLDGSLCLQAEGRQPIELPRLGQLVVGRAAAVMQTAGSSGATLYLRRRTVELNQLPASEARWWAAAEATSWADAGRDRPWSDFFEGAVAADLQTAGEVVSMLVRLTPGAVLPDHGHGLDEDCFMIEGDMFLGDILMRAGDYQLARAGGQHLDSTSDTGGLFYFHGVLPGAASVAAA